MTSGAQRASVTVSYGRHVASYATTLAINYKPGGRIITWTTIRIQTTSVNTERANGRGKNARGVWGRRHRRRDPVNKGSSVPVRVVRQNA